MKNLHIISRSPADNVLQTCAPLIKSGDALLFLEDGVYHLGNETALAPLQAETSTYFLHEDLEARGLLNKTAEETATANYEDFVNLCCEYDKVISWF